MSEDSLGQSANHQQVSTLPMIYILGNSHSGSTLLGFLLTANPTIVNLGELKGRSWIKERFCSCGNPVADCRFYGNYFSSFNALKKNVVSKIRATKPIQFFINRNIKLDVKSSEELQQFYNSLSNQVASVMPDAQFIVDTSKSVSLLNGWLNVMPRNQIKIIFLKRQTKANVASFVKRGFPFFSSSLSVLINNRLIKHYLRRNKLDYLEVDYNRFYEYYDDEAKKMSAFIGVEIPSSNRIPINHHVIGGNNRTKDSFTNKVAGIHKDEEWKRTLTGFQKNFLNLIS